MVKATHDPFERCALEHLADFYGARFSAGADWYELRRGDLFVLKMRRVVAGVQCALSICDALVIDRPFGTFNEAVGACVVEMAIWYA